MEIIAFFTWMLQQDFSPLYFILAFFFQAGNLVVYSISCAAEPDLVVLAPPVTFLLLIDADEAGTGNAGPEGLVAVDF